MKYKKIVYTSILFIIVTGILVILFKTEVFLDKTSEGYCKRFTYNKCPITCKVKPSCPACMDIGCHSNN